MSKGYAVSVAGLYAKISVNLQDKIEKIELSYQPYQGLDPHPELNTFINRCYNLPMEDEDFNRLSCEGCTPFQSKVYRALSSISKGVTLSYKQLAEKIGNPKAFRAVGHAMALNPFPLIVPCHRVVLSNGDTGQFAFGSAMKMQLLLSEKKG